VDEPVPHQHRGAVCTEPRLPAAAEGIAGCLGIVHGRKPLAAPGGVLGGFGASKAGLNYLTKVAADEWDVYPNLRVNQLIPGPVNSPQRNRTHPGEAKSERADLATLMPYLLYWLSADSKGRSGEIIELDLRSKKGE
jgi:NAD(P)-dependent dehydrogenase (short-subunit alcohol dehydrogenase family)